MSCFSSQLKVALERTKMSREELAQASGLSYSLLTNLANDRRDPDPETVAAIGLALPPAAAADLLIALWCDVCPERLRHLVHLVPAEKSSVLEEPMAKYEAAPKLPADVEAALDRIRRGALKHAEWRSALVTLAKTIPVD
jgi:transcriptional regulator with XRE-family HTH domain